MIPVHRSESVTADLQGRKEKSMFLNFWTIPVLLGNPAAYVFSLMLVQMRVVFSVSPCVVGPPFSGPKPCEWDSFAISLVNG